MKNIILIIFLILLIIILEILLILNKRHNSIKESLIVSPIKLYNSSDNSKDNNKIDEALCELNTLKDLNGIKTNFITMDDYLKIKSSNADERPTSELVGKMIRIFIPKEEEINLTDYNIPSEENNKCFLNNENTDSNKQCTITTPEFTNLTSTEPDNPFNNITSNCSGDNFKEFDYSSLPADVLFNYSNYFLYDTGGCWFDANIINYLQIDDNTDPSITPCSLHKIAWMDEEKIKYIRWINLNDYKIEVPIMENSVSLNSDLNSSINSKNFDFKNNYSLNTSFIDTNCNDNLKVNYYGNIDCNTNADCNLNNTSNLKFYCIKNKCSY